MTDHRDDDGDYEIEDPTEQAKRELGAALESAFTELLLKNNRCVDLEERIASINENRVFEILNPEKIDIYPESCLCKDEAYFRKITDRFETSYRPSVARELLGEVKQFARDRKGHRRLYFDTLNHCEEQVSARLVLTLSFLQWFIPRWDADHGATVEGAPLCFNHPVVHIHHPKTVFVGAPARSSAYKQGCCDMQAAIQKDLYSAFICWQNAEKQYESKALCELPGQHQDTFLGMMDTGRDYFKEHWQELDPRHPSLTLEGRMTVEKFIKGMTGSHPLSQGFNGPRLHSYTATTEDPIVQADANYGAAMAAVPASAPANTKGKPGPGRKGKWIKYPQLKCDILNYAKNHSEAATALFFNARHKQETGTNNELTRDMVKNLIAAHKKKNG